MMPVKKNSWLPNILNDFWGNEWIERSSAVNPAVNIIENDKQYKVEVAAPGMTKNDFSIELQDDKHMIVSMEKKSEKKEEDKESKYLRREFSYVSFRQNLILPDNVDLEKIEAKVTDGVLTIEIPKKKEVKKAHAIKQIAIK